MVGGMWTVQKRRLCTAGAVFVHHKMEGVFLESGDRHHWNPVRTGRGIPKLTPALTLTLYHSQAIACSPVRQFVQQNRQGVSVTWGGEVPCGSVRGP